MSLEYQWEGLITNTRKKDYYVARKKAPSSWQPETINVSSFSYDSVFWINGHNLGPEANQLILGLPGRCWNNSWVDAYDNFLNPPTICKQTNGYIYGFSTMLTLIFAAFEIIWAVGMFGVWWDANKASEMNRWGLRRNGVLRNVTDLSEAMRRDLGNSTCSYSNDELEKSLKKRKLRYVMEGSGEGSVVHVGLSSSEGPKVKLERGIQHI